MCSREWQQAAQQAMKWAAGYEQLLIHFDVDVLTYVECPIAEHVRRCEGCFDAFKNELRIFRTITATNLAWSLV
jgi:hypothetical protein